MWTQFEYVYRCPVIDDNQRKETGYVRCKKCFSVYRVHNFIGQPKVDLLESNGYEFEDLESNDETIDE